MEKDNIIINGWENEGTFYLLDSYRIQGNTYHMVESEIFGEELVIFINDKKDYVCQTYNGIDDLYEHLAI